MKMVFTFPFCSPEVNSISGGPIYIGSQGHDVLVVTARRAESLKGSVSAPASETIQGTEFFRPYSHAKDLTWRPQVCWLDVQKKVIEHTPHVVIGFGDPFYRLPLMISRYFNIPLVMFFEYLRPEKISLPIRGSGKIKRVFPTFYRRCSRLFRRYLFKQCSAIMFSYYGDRPLIPTLKAICKAVHYVPWCTEMRDVGHTVKRKRNVGIYIGSLTTFKNAAELVENIPLILEHTETEQFIVVGPGEFAPQIRQLSEKYKPKIKYIESLSRTEAMRLLRSTGYGYTPVTDSGLGFIGDCWGTETPLIASHRLDGFLRKDVDTLIADSAHELPHVINSLLVSDELFERMQRGGKKRYESDHTAQAVGGKYLQILQKAIQSDFET